MIVQCCFADLLLSVRMLQVATLNWNVNCRKLGRLSMLSLDGSTCRSGCVDGLAGHVQTVLANSASFHCVCNIQAHSIALTNWLFCVKEMKCCQSCNGLPRAAQSARVSTNSFPWFTLVAWAKEMFTCEIKSGFAESQHTASQMTRMDSPGRFP